MLDIATLRFIWWALLGILILGFALMDGFDFGAATLLPFVTRDTTERRIIYNVIGPVWEGNQVWLILGAGAMFAAWPFVYAVAFSGFYFLMLLLLVTMGISRPVSIKYRGKLKNPTWQLFWDGVLFIGGIVPALLFGLMLGNVLIGAPFYFDQELRVYYVGGFADFFQPFAILCALTSLFMLMMHGGLFLAIKTRDAISKRAVNMAQISAILFLICFVLGGYFLTKINGMKVISGLNPNGYSNPLTKTVISAQGAWLHNYMHYPLGWALPGLGVGGAIIAFLTARVGNHRLAFMGSSLCIMGVLTTLGFSLYPFILPSSYHPASSLLIWDASSSRLTLLIMLAAAIFFMPIILIYTAWVYRALSGPVCREQFEQDKHHTSY